MCDPKERKSQQLGCSLWNAKHGEILINPSRAVNEVAVRGG
jgi:hypothetical protein